jgi:hypothetical protein
MLCPLCGHRKRRRDCPALARTICPVCCGTKRLVEIPCPSDCGYLTSAREHPAAVVRRQQARDVTRVLPTIRHLTERQHQLFFLFHALIARHRPQGFARVVDSDVAQAAAVLAATFETASRGVIYEHTAQSPVANAIIAEIRTMLAQMREQGAKVYDGEVTIVLRAIEEGARATGLPGEGEAVYVELMGRLLQVQRQAEQTPASAKPAGALIIP